mmetsp:Transcript_22733/g.77350  ORF Transcript_22733/g.77350 Transcript_22733/m.77350 type:complete len:225 (+) Transcript_22733:1444-2118(+)
MECFARLRPQSYTTHAPSLVVHTSLVVLPTGARDTTPPTTAFPSFSTACGLVWLTFHSLSTAALALVVTKPPGMPGIQKMSLRPMVCLLNAIICACWSASCRNMEPSLSAVSRYVSLRWSHFAAHTGPANLNLLHDLSRTFQKCTVSSDATATMCLRSLLQLTLSTLLENSFTLCTSLVCTFHCTSTLLPAAYTSFGSTMAHSSRPALKLRPLVAVSWLSVSMV